MKAFQIINYRLGKHIWIIDSNITCFLDMECKWSFSYSTNGFNKNSRISSQKKRSFERFCLFLYNFSLVKYMLIILFFTLLLALSPHQPNLNYSATGTFSACLCNLCC